MTARRWRTERARKAKAERQEDMGRYFSPQQLRDFDAAFKRAMITAIAAGAEYAPIGIFRAKPKVMRA